MTRYRVTWSGSIAKTIAVETPADALYHVWSRYRDDFAGGSIDVGLDEASRGAQLAQLSFPVRIGRDIEAENPAEAVRSFLYDDRVPSLVRVQDIEVEPAELPAFDHPEAALAAE